MKMGSYGLKQVIFLIDTTASVAPYWADLKKYYIFPIINFFNNSEVPTKGKSCDSAFSNRIFKGSSDSSHFIFEINVGKKRTRHRTTLNSNDGVN